MIRVISRPIPHAPQIQKGVVTMNDLRVLIVFDGDAWFVRRLRAIEHDLDKDEKVYHCDPAFGWAVRHARKCLLRGEAHS